MENTRKTILFNNYENQEKMKPYSSLIYYCAKSSKQRARDTEWKKPFQKEKHNAYLEGMCNLIGKIITHPTK